MAKLNDTWTVQPHGDLIEVAEGILTVAGTIEMPLGAFPRRMTVIALEDGGTAIWSPVPLREPDMATIEALGPIRALIVPNMAHRLDLGPWKHRYPDALVITPPDACDAVSEAAPVDACEDVIHDPAVKFALTDGTKAGEFALIVTRDDGVTLILNDILSSIRHPKGLGANVMARLMGFGIKRPRTSRPVRRMWVGDPKSVARQFEAWAAIPKLRRIIVSHVDVIDDAPAQALKRAAEDFR